MHFVTPVIDLTLLLADQGIRSIPEFILYEYLECSPLGEPCKSSLSFDSFRVKLKLDTPVKSFPA